MNFFVNQHIGVFEDAFDEGYCKDLIDFFETHQTEIYRREDYWESSPDLIGKAVDSSIELTAIMEKYQDDPIGQKANQFRQFFFEALIKYFEVYSRKVNIHPHAFGLNSFKVQKTDPSEGYHVWHWEYPSSLGHIKQIEGGWDNIEAQELYTRIAAYTLYLNDVEEGGETEFLQQSYRLPPKRGTLCIFPASYTHVHRGNPPLKGSKYIMTGWLVLPNENEVKINE